MILRRIAKGIKTQDWFVVMLEVLIVVVGIFIGLQVDDWNEGRKTQERESEYLAALSEDLKTVRSNVESAIKTHENLASYGLKALEILRGERLIAYTNRDLAEGILYQHRLPFPQIRLGELGVILDHQIQVPVSDTAKRRALIDLVDRLNNLLEIYAHIIVSMDQAHSLHLDVVSPPIVTVVDGKGVTQMPARMDLEALKLDTKFQNSLQNIVSRHATSSYMLNSIIDAIDKYLEVEENPSE